MPRAAGRLAALACLALLACRTASPTPPAPATAPPVPTSPLLSGPAPTELVAQAADAPARLSLPWLLHDAQPLIALPPTAVLAAPGPGPETGPGPELGPCAGMVRRAGADLLLNGQPTRFFGINATYLTEPDFPESEVPGIVRGLAERGVTAVRVWFQAGQDPERLARLLDLGAQHGLYFILAMGDNVHDGVDWFFSEEDEEEFRPHLAETVARFANRPEVLAWEPVNEPNCGEGRFDEACVKTVRDWVSGTAADIRRMDACHLISSGMIGAGNFEVDQSSYRTLNKKDSLDLISVHRAIDQEPEEELELADDIEKPVLYGEIYAIAHDDDCSPLSGGRGPGARAGRIASDVREAWEAGVDVYLLWDLNVGRFRRDGGEDAYYCSKFGYELGDPVWGAVREGS